MWCTSYFNVSYHILTAHIYPCNINCQFLAQFLLPGSYELGQNLIVDTQTVLNFVLTVSTHLCVLHILIHPHYNRKTPLGPIASSGEYWKCFLLFSSIAELYIQCTVDISTILISQMHLFLSNEDNISKLKLQSILGSKNCTKTFLASSK